MRKLKSVLASLCVACLTLTLAVPAAGADMTLDAVNRVSLGQYKTYQIDIESMGLGLYGGPDYDQGFRNRDGWAGGGTLGNDETRLYLIDQLAAMGLDVSVQGPYQNVVGELPGTQTPEDIYIVCGHFDTTSGGERPGGDDNASGTAGVLEAARVLTQYRFESTLRFIGFNAEEDWMLGSDDYVYEVLLANNANVAGVINLDMILRPGWDGDPHAIIDADIISGESANDLAWVNLFMEAVAAYTPSLVIDAGSPHTTYWYASDQGPFIEVGYPALMVSESTAPDIWSRESNAYYHSAQDASDALANDPHSPSGVTYDYAFATDIVRATVGTLARSAGLVPEPVPGFGEYQSVSADAAGDPEFFTIGDEAYLAVANGRDDANDPGVTTLYRWDESGFVEYQHIATNGARDFQFFTIADESYLAVANAGDDITPQVDSTILRWDGDRFVEHQSIATNGAADCEFFTIADEHYLVVANAGGDTAPEADSWIYKWNGVGFEPFQAILTNGASDCEPFTIGDDAYLAIANMGSDSMRNIDSVIYQWDGTAFVEFQPIPTHGAADWESFAIGDDAYLAVANMGDGATPDLNGDGATPDLNSELYKWDGTGFALLQSIPTYEARDWEAFAMDEVPYLAVANGNGSATPDGNSRIYRWNGTRFVEFAAVPGPQAGYWEFFTVDDRYYLGLTHAADDGPESTVLAIQQYRWFDPGDTDGDAD